MGANDMNHMNHLESVVLSDCAVLETKEGTYQGSWKKAGGRSAWFMARRNIDRLLVMMQSKPIVLDLSEQVDTNTGMVTLPLEALQAAMASEDIFRMIGLRPGGEDGTVLAVIRDLRRYLVLVEAEMIACGVVEPETAIPRVKEDAYSLYDLIAKQTGVAVEEVKQRVHDMFYGPDAGEQRARYVGVAEQPSPAQAVLVSGLATGDTPSCGDGSFDVKQQRLDEQRSGGRYAAERAGQRTPEDGAQHASLVPFQVNKGYYDALHIRVGNVADLFYSQRAGDVWQLEPVVGGSVGLPREIGRIYWHYVGEDGSRWVLHRRLVPQDIDDNFPRLQVEMNQKEFDESFEGFRFMYAWHEEPQKWILRPNFSEWGREV